MKNIFRAFILFITIQGMAQKPSDRQAILLLLQNQQSSWNDGDIEGFMQAYWKNDSLIFIGNTGPQNGWNNTIQRYRSTYNTADKMGQLTFNVLNLEFLSKKSCRVLGRWDLKRPVGSVGGYFTLIFRKTAEGWKIVYDHTS